MEIADLEQLVRELAALPGMAAVVLGGSYAAGRRDQIPTSTSGCLPR